MFELRPWLALIFRRPGRLVLGGLLILATLLSGIGLLALSGWFITETALVGILLAAGVQASVNLYVPGGGIRFFAVSRTVARYMERVYNHDTVLRLLTDIRVTLFRELAAANRAGREHLSGPQWLSRLTSDVDALDTLYLRLIAPTALALVVILLLALMAWLLFDCAVAAGVLMVTLLALVIATLAVYLVTRRASSRQSDRQEALRTAVVEHIEGFGELRAAGRTGRHGAWLLRQAHGMNAEQARVESRVGWHQAVSQLLVNLAAILALWAGYELFRADVISGPVLVLLPIAILGLTEVMTVLPDAFGKLGSTIASARRLNRDTASDHPPIEIPAPPEGLALQASDLAVQYPGYAPVVTHLDMALAPGERVGITGRSGSGKSSVADTLAGLLQPARGTLARLPCAYLTQQTVLFDDSLRANLRMGCSTATDGDLWRVLEMVELAERFAREPDQLDSWLGNTGSRLSGGEARRVALARVLLSPAPLLILDEPFTGVDADTRARISKRLERWLDGKTLVALAHGPDALPATDRVIPLG
ncbi:thiol reductant ABC exporter subunit CydC [Marinobacter oulmenensis]|uniref:ATP-binding cassette subfamily C protein CydC n=1 Tax=Marinobacter oulmenensis TaxID=643747 RepID=A0A840U4D0_9GAMM|nr:thiol reductant ABC exporter subunit CydC [Marinobacter oulmenensis]MBB5320574.1 ATP-binding cassette subfamily C protein CydC [Marinobacter oulmenensis]